MYNTRRPLIAIGAGLAALAAAPAAQAATAEVSGTTVMYDLDPDLAVERKPGALVVV